MIKSRLPSRLVQWGGSHGVMLCFGRDLDFRHEGSILSAECRDEMSLQSLGHSPRWLQYFHNFRTGDLLAPKVSASPTVDAKRMPCNAPAAMVSQCCWSIELWCI
jgi:hypothetical protein